MLGALVLWVHDLERAAAFYRTLGVPLEEERHDDEPAHYACDLGDIHFALAAFDGGRAPGYRVAGGTMPGFVVDSLSVVRRDLQTLGARVLQEPTEYPWGVRILVEDPDGRAIEVYERSAG